MKNPEMLKFVPDYLKTNKMCKYHAVKKLPYLLRYILDGYKTQQICDDGFHLYEYMSDFEKFKEELPSKEKFYSYLTDKKFSDKEYEHALKVWNKFEMKTMKDCYDLYLKCDVFC